MDLTRLDRLQQSLGYCFTDAALCRLALSHCSFSVDNNERLEFLGDAILNFVIAEALYQRFAEAREGELSRLRASLVNESTLARLAVELGVGGCLLLGDGEQKSGGRARKSILADAVEAIIGAIYLVIVCLLPEFLISAAGVPFYLGGTSLLIVVSVTMDTVAQVQGHLLAHQYEGLVKKARLRGGKRGK